MLDELAVGILLNVLVMLLHLGATLAVAVWIRRVEVRFPKRHILCLVLVLLIVNITLLTAHLLGVGCWAAVYLMRDLVSNPADAYYSALVNYTTLGFGDALHGTRTRLLGPMAAASGILMFGWTAALLVYVMQTRLPKIVDAPKH